MNPEKKNEEGEMPRIELVNISFFDEINDKLEFNLPIMPYFFTLLEIPNYQFYSIYIEGMKCIACGMYSAGIMVLGQLFEAILSEIILVKTGKRQKGMMFGQLIGYARKKKLLQDHDLLFLTSLNKDLRNVYVHQNYAKILGKQETDAYPIDLSGGDFFESVKNGLEDVRSGNATPLKIRPIDDPSIATAFKEPVDHLQAIVLSWVTNIYLEQLVNIYLSNKAYDEYREIFGHL